MKCAEFQVMVEELLERAEVRLPADVQRHAESCGHCRSDFEMARRSHELLKTLRQETPAVEPYFLTRLQSRIRSQEAKEAKGWLVGARIAGRDLALASALFAVMLGSFVYNFQRTERPNMDEAMALDVPHTNPMHPADDHAKLKPADAMLSLMNP